MINTSNRGIPLKPLQILGKIDLEEIKVVKGTKQDKEFINSVLATQKIDLSEVPIEHVARLRELQSCFCRK